MRRIIWSARARADLISIRVYLGSLNPAAAERISTGLVVMADLLSEMPDRGRPLAPSRREVTAIYPYIMRYRVHPEAVVILSIRHGAQALR